MFYLLILSRLPMHFFLSVFLKILKCSKFSQLKHVKVLFGKKDKTLTYEKSNLGWSKWNDKDREEIKADLVLVK